MFAVEAIISRMLRTCVGNASVVMGGWRKYYSSVRCAEEIGADLLRMAGIPLNDASLTLANFAHLGAANAHKFVLSSQVLITL